MSPLTKSLEKRIQELRSSIEAQTKELAVFEQALALESNKPASMEAASAPVVAPKAVPGAYKKSTPPPPKPSASAPPPAASAGSVGLVFNGSRSDFVGAVLKHGGAGGASPAEISAAFASRKIAISKNLVYNVLSLMFKRKRVRKSNGRYYLLGKPTEPASSSATASNASSGKSRISEEGRQRIIAATKKRWAAQKASKAKGK